MNLFEVCKACLAGKTPWKCTHNQDRISASKSKAARDQTLALYRDGQQAVALRELFGQASKNTTNLIPTEHSDLFLKSAVHITSPVRALYIGIDPGGGGPGELGVVGIAETFDLQGSIPGPRLAVRSKGSNWTRLIGLTEATAVLLSKRMTFLMNHVSLRLLE